ncbi:MAG: DUF86 domain-containing protein [Nanoarchaeota archaeon]|nr:DUF86 domain-containing protein [Nanoarchaeota archaeon]
MIKRKELRKDRIKNKVEQIINSLEFINENFPDDFEEFKSSKVIRNAVYKEIEYAIENIIDVCSIINSDLRLGSPETEDSIFEHIEKNKTFTKTTIDSIKEMKKFRNILIHKYGEINDEKAFENIKEGLADFEKVIKEIEGFLKKN